MGNTPPTYYYKAATWTYSSSTWTRTDLNQLSGQSPAHNHAFAYALNDSGLIVGGSTSDAVGSCPVFAVKAVYWNGSNTAVALPTLGSDVRSYAYSVNNNGVVVGWSEDNSSTPVRRAFRYDVGGSIYDLNDYIPFDDTDWEIVEAHDINDAGWIVGVAKASQDNDELRAVLLVPQPRCTGDLNGDGTIDGADLGLLLGLWGPVVCNDSADFDESGDIDGGDLGVLLGAWGDCSAPLLEEENPVEVLMDGQGLDTIEEFVDWLLQMEFPMMKAWLLNALG